MMYLDACGGVAHSHKKQQVSKCANTDHRTTERSTSDSLGDFLGFRNFKPLYSCTEGMFHSSTHPGTSYHMTQFNQAFPRVSAKNTGARRPGYEATVVLGCLACIREYRCILAWIKVQSSYSAVLV